MKKAADKLLEHVVFLARRFDRDCAREFVDYVLVELDVPSHYEGNEFLALAIMLGAEYPLRLFNASICAQVAELCGCTEKQVEQAMIRAINAAWQEREDCYWELYFPPKFSRQYTRPTVLVFISKLAKVVRLWEGCSRSSSLERETEEAVTCEIT